MSEPRTFNSRNEASIADLEEELNRLEAERKGVPIEAKKEPEAEPEHVEPEAIAAPQEGDTWQKRYSDYRRYVEKELKAGMQKQIDDLKRQLTESTKQQIVLPKSDAEIEAWAEEYPDIAAIIETIAAKKVMAAKAEVDTLLEDVQKDKKAAAREKAEAQLMKKHPDLYELRDTAEFHEWIQDQGGWVEKALYHNNDNWKDASNAIDLYKLHKGLHKSPSKKSDSEQTARDAARHVPARERAEEPKSSGQYLFSESQIEKMSIREYEEKEAEITKAFRAGKILRDRSGAAR